MIDWVWIFDAEKYNCGWIIFLRDEWEFNRSIIWLSGIFDPSYLLERNPIFLGFKLLLGIIIRIKSKVQLYFNSTLEFSKTPLWFSMRFSKISYIVGEGIIYLFDPLFILFHE